MSLQRLHNSFSQRSLILLDIEALNPCLAWTENPMKMARHHDECQQFVALLGLCRQWDIARAGHIQMRWGRCEKAHCVLHDLSQLRSREMSNCWLPIEPFVNPGK